MSRLNITLFGEFRVHVAGLKLVLPTRKSQALLAYLAMRPGQAHSRDKLSGLLWTAARRSQARHSLRQALTTLRAHVPRPAATFVLEGQMVALHPKAADVDVVEFERLVRSGAPGALDRAAALYHGDLLDGTDLDEEPFEEWLRAERARFREAIVQVLTRLVEHHTHAGAGELAISAATRLLAIDPFREDIHRALMRLLAKQGRRGDALRQYQLCVSVLQRELGVEPMDETRQVYREMLPDRRPGSWLVGSASAETRAGALRDNHPLVGRVAELAELNDVLAGAWRGRGQVAVLVGHAGIGKTRLVEEMAGRALKKGGRVLVGRAFDAERALPFAPWVDVLRGGFRLYDEGGVRSPNLIWRGELAKLLPELGEPAGAPPTQNALRLFESVAHVLRDLASRWPLVVVLEDLHWADEMSIRLFTFLAHRIEAWPLLMLATVRDERVDEAPLLRRFLRAPDIGSRVRQLTLAPLSREHSAALVRALAGRDLDAPAAVGLAEQVWLLGEGNPFLIVEILRALDTGELPGAPTHLAVPQRVREVIAARIERLGGPARRLVSVAAVAGREFDFALLQQVTALDESRTAEGVEELVRRRLIHPVGEGFDFTHPSIREVASAQLPPHERKALHRRLATAMEVLHQDDLAPFYLVIARHLVEGEAWREAVGYLGLGGMQALERSANREAVSLLTQALDSLRRVPRARPALEQRIDLLIALSYALMSGGEPTPALDHLAEAKRLGGVLGDRWRLGWIASHLSEGSMTVGQHDEAIASGSRGLAIGTELADLTLQTETRLRVAQARHARGEYREALTLLRANLSEAPPPRESVPAEASLLATLVAQRSGSGAWLALSRTWLVGCLTELGEFGEGSRHGWDGLRLVEASSPVDPSARVLAQLALGRLLVRKGDVKEAILLLERCRDSVRLGGFDVWSPAITATLGYAHLLAGRAAEAVTLLAEAVDQGLSMNVLHGHALHLAYLGEAALAAGRVDEARAHAGRALEHARTHGERGHEAFALRLLAVLGAHGDSTDVASSERAYREALALADELGMRPLAALCHLGRGTLLAQTGRGDAAREDRGRATAMCREMAMNLWLGVAEVEAMKSG